MMFTMFSGHCLLLLWPGFDLQIQKSNKYIYEPKYTRNQN